MTMFEFMQNAFYLLCGIACIAVAFLIIYVSMNVVVRAAKGSKSGRRLPKEKNNGRS